MSVKSTRKREVLHQRISGRKSACLLVSRREQIVSIACLHRYQYHCLPFLHGFMAHFPLLLIIRFEFLPFHLLSPRSNLSVFSSISWKSSINLGRWIIPIVSILQIRSWRQTEEVKRENKRRTGRYDDNDNITNQHTARDPFWSTFFKDSIKWWAHSSHLEDIFL